MYRPPVITNEGFLLRSRPSLEFALKVEETGFEVVSVADTVRVVAALQQVGPECHAFTVGQHGGTMCVFDDRPARHGRSFDFGRDEA